MKIEDSDIEHVSADIAKLPITSSIFNDYAGVFNSVEGNTTFYAAPKPETVERWADQAPEGFKFCFKFPKAVTHDRKLVDVKDEALAFIDLLEPLADRLGPFFVGLPATFGPPLLDALGSFLMQMPDYCHFAVEFRHPAFFGDVEETANQLLADVRADRIHFHTETLRRLRTVDSEIVESQQNKPAVPYRDNAIGPHPFVRFVGPPNPADNEAHLIRWAHVVAKWIEEEREPYFFVHHPPSDVYAPLLARFFHEKLSALVDVGEMPAWPIETKQASQLNLF